MAQDEAVGQESGGRRHESIYEKGEIRSESAVNRRRPAWGWFSAAAASPLPDSESWSAC